jgi:hypothetical protein
MGRAKGDVSASVFGTGRSLSMRSRTADVDKSIVDERGPAVRRYVLTDGSGDTDVFEFSAGPDPISVTRYRDGKPEPAEASYSDNRFHNADGPAAVYREGVEDHDLHMEPIIGLPPHIK